MKNKKSQEADKAENSTMQKSTAAPAVRVVVGPNKTLTFEGEATNWDGVEAMLQKVPPARKQFWKLPLRLRMCPFAR